jgi:acetyltransferase-like isoleucine patch superfamily enzyme
MFEYEDLSEQEFEELISELPRKIARWIGTHHPDNHTRKKFFRATGVQIGEGVVLNPNLIIQDSYNPLVKIGERVSIGSGVMIIADSAPNNSKLQEMRYVKEHLIVSKEVIIEEDAWIGAGAVIMPGVVIGKGAIVGASSVVTKNVAPYTVVVGIPARETRKLSNAP